MRSLCEKINHPITSHSGKLDKQGTHTLGKMVKNHKHGKQIEIPDELHLELKKRAVEKGSNLKTVAKEAIEKYLKVKSK